MSTTEIRFDDGGAYERYMGRWSQLVGSAFIDWVAPERGWRWLDVGCGNGAFTEMLAERCAPAALAGIDPSEPQLAYARSRRALRGADFRNAGAMALPFDADAFDAAVMPLVIFFVPDPAKGIAEMARVVRGGGVVAAYAWDLAGGGFPYDALWSEIENLGATVPMPPSPDASNLDVMGNLWTAAGLEQVETRAITVERTFANFDDYWSTILGGPSVSGALKSLTPEKIASLQSRLRARFPGDATGRITCGARANAVKGRVSRNR